MTKNRQGKGKGGKKMIVPTISTLAFQTRDKQGKKRISKERKGFDGDVKLSTNI